MKRMTALFTENTESNLPAILQLAKEEEYELQGIFLRHVKPMPALQYPFVNDLNLTQPPVMEVITEQEDLQPAQERLKRIQEQCQLAGVPFAGTLLEDASLEDILFYSSFADLFLLDGTLPLEEYVISPLNISMEDLLIRSYCPVLVLPSGAAQTQKTILAYDGHHSTLFAIRMYSYLFSSSRHRPTLLVTVNPAETEQPNLDSLRHWLLERFSNAELTFLNGKAREELVKYIQEQTEPVLVVMGAFGGDALSRLFHQSIASTVLKETKAAVFITHQ